MILKQTGCKNFHVKAFHEGIKYLCDKCDYTALRNKSIKHHQEVVHEGIRKYPFNKCEYQATTKSHLDRHIGYKLYIKILYV